MSLSKPLKSDIVILPYGPTKSGKTTFQELFARFFGATLPQASREARERRDSPHSDTQEISQLASCIVKLPTGDGTANVGESSPLDSSDEGTETIVLIDAPGKGDTDQENREKHHANMVRFLGENSVTTIAIFHPASSLALDEHMLGMFAALCDEFPREIWPNVVVIVTFASATGSRSQIAKIKRLYDEALPGKLTEPQFFAFNSVYGEEAHDQLAEEHRFKQECERLVAWLASLPVRQLETRLFEQRQRLRAERGEKHDQLATAEENATRARSELEEISRAAALKEAEQRGNANYTSTHTTSETFVQCVSTKTEVPGSWPRNHRDSETIKHGYVGQDKRTYSFDICTNCKSRDLDPINGTAHRIVQKQKSQTTTNTAMKNRYDTLGSEIRALAVQQGALQTRITSLEEQQATLRGQIEALTAELAQE